MKDLWRDTCFALILRTISGGKLFAYDDTNDEGLRQRYVHGDPKSVDEKSDDQHSERTAIGGESEDPEKEISDKETSEKDDPEKGGDEDYQLIDFLENDPQVLSNEIG